MAVIKPKKKPVIQKGVGYSYNPLTFKAEHWVPNFIEVETPEEMLSLVKPYELDDMKLIWFDTETHPYYKNSHEVPPHIVRRWVGTGKKAVPQDYPFCISICDGVNSYVIFDTFENGFAKFKKLAPLFEDPTIDKVAHNAKFDMHMFHNAGLKIVGKIHDTVVMAKLANENRNSFQLRDLAARYHGNITKFEYMVDSYKSTFKVSDYRMIAHELMVMYTCADTWNDYLCFINEYKKIKECELTRLYNNELQLMMALYAMERYGMKADDDYEQPIKQELQKLTDDAERSIYEEAGKVFNVNSGPQLYNVLLSLGVGKDVFTFTEAGNPTLDKWALEALAIRYEIPLIEKLLTYRKYEKLLSTYAVGIYEQKDSISKVHASINQTEATTGRMSIVKPALQTLPKKDKSIRKVFIPSDDYELWFMDLDQIEYRLLAHYAIAEGLIEAIKNGHDVHRATGAILYHKPIDEVTDDERQRGKTMNFSLVYGQGDDATALALKKTVTEARSIKAEYFAKIPEVKPFITTVHTVVRQRGYVRNFYGRRRRLTSDEAYKAPNALIQGCAADYIKDKLVGIYKYLMYNKLLSRAINIVHDELIFEIHATEHTHIPKLRWLLSDFTHFRCPITAGLEYGAPSWGQKKEPEGIGFEEPTDKGYLEYNVFNGEVFDIGKVS